MFGRDGGPPRRRWAPVRGPGPRATARPSAGPSLGERAASAPRAAGAAGTRTASNERSRVAPRAGRMCSRVACRASGRTRAASSTSSGGSASGVAAAEGEPRHGRRPGRRIVTTVRPLSSFFVAIGARRRHEVAQLLRVPRGRARHDLAAPPPRAQRTAPPRARAPLGRRLGAGVNMTARACSRVRCWYASLATAGARDGLARRPQVGHRHAGCPSRSARRRLVSARPACVGSSSSCSDLEAPLEVREVPPGSLGSRDHRLATRAPRRPARRDRGSAPSAHEHAHEEDARADAGLQDGAHVADLRLLLEQLSRSSTSSCSHHSSVSSSVPVSPTAPGSRHPIHSSGVGSGELLRSTATALAGAASSAGRSSRAPLAGRLRVAPQRRRQALGDAWPASSRRAAPRRATSCARPEVLRGVGARLRERQAAAASRASRQRARVGVPSRGTATA
jgi:hypothetical protein